VVRDTPSSAASEASVAGLRTLDDPDMDRRYPLRRCG
jgi:hypothetical protein